MLVVEKDPLASYKFNLSPELVSKFHYYGFTKLEDHLHEIVFFFALYTAIHVLSILLSPYLLPAYNKLSGRNKVNFNIHVVSQVQCIWVVIASYPLFKDPNLNTLESYSPYGGFVLAGLIGYFIWDLAVCLRYSVLFGPAFSLHALTALFTFAQGMRPFLYNYAAPFIWFEASTPFVNVHWFASHVPGLISDTLFTINGLCLIVVFFVCRIIFGSINGVTLWKELIFDYPESIPKWVAGGVFLCYVALMGLNFMWFGKMIEAATAKMKKKQD